MRRFEYTSLLFQSAFVVALVLIALFASSILPVRNPQSQYASVSVASPFVYSFNSPGVLNESASMSLSTSPYWWLNSGGQFIIENNTGNTMRGDAPVLNKWRILYALSNPIDTDNGKHPQNIFRMVSRSQWTNVRMEARFKILKDNWSTSPNQNASNGLFLTSRYVDDRTLYYAGLRVDGKAIIKKKYNGVYYTMAQKQEFAGIYVEDGHISMLPHQTWIGLRSETSSNSDGSVSVRLYMQREDGIWKKLLEVRDDGSHGGTPPIVSTGFTGIRTDFMDVSFNKIRIENIN